MALATEPCLRRSSGLPHRRCPCWTVAAWQEFGWGRVFGFSGADDLARGHNPKILGEKESPRGRRIRSGRDGVYYAGEGDPLVEPRLQPGDTLKKSTRLTNPAETKESKRTQVEGLCIRRCDVARPLYAPSWGVGEQKVAGEGIVIVALWPWLTFQHATECSEVGIVHSGKSP